MTAWTRWRSPTALHVSVALHRNSDSTVFMSNRAALVTKARKGSGDAEVPPRCKKSMLVDGNNALYHFYNPLCSADSDGVQREAVDGLIRLLQRMDKTHVPEHICVFFDSKRKPTIRKLIDPTYKSLRKPTPQSLGPQLASAAGILREGGVNCITVPGFEADDLIASYTEAYVAAGYEVLVVSNDNDFLQLVRGAASVPDAATNTSQSTDAPPPPHQEPGDGESRAEDVTTPAAFSSTAVEPPSRGYVELYQPNKRRYVRERHVQSRFGLPHAHLVPAFLALVGTRWGKIQKVEHMTDERAVALLTQYGSLPKLLRSLNEIEDPALRKSLKHAISSIETSLRIAQLNNQIALPVAIADMVAPALENLTLSLSLSLSPSQKQPTQQHGRSKHRATASSSAGARTQVAAVEGEHADAART